MSGGVVQATGERGAASAATTWAAGIRALVPVPPEHRRLDADAAAVRALLRCKAEEVEELRQGGMACVERDGVLFFDPVDVYNVGLLSRSRRTVPEAASSHFARLARGGVERWTAPAETQVGVEWPAQADGPALEDELGVLRREARDAQGRQTATYVPHRTVRAAVSPRLESLFRSSLDDLSFQLLPQSLKQDAAAIERLGVGDCDGLSLVLAERCRSAGFEATVERGHLRDRFGWGDHAWVRVRDEDGRPRMLDLTLPLLAASQGVDADDFSRFCCGNVLTAVVPHALHPGSGPPVPLSLIDTRTKHS